MIVQVDAPNLEEAFVQAGRAVVDTTIDALASEEKNRSK